MECCKFYVFAPIGYNQSCTILSPAKISHIFHAPRALQTCMHTVDYQQCGFQHEKYASRYWFLGWKFSLQHLVYLWLAPSVQYKPCACRPPMPNSNKSSMVKPPPLPPPPLFFFLKYHFFHRLEGKNTFLIGFKRKPLFQSVFNTNHFFYRFLQKTLYSSLFTTKRFFFKRKPLFKSVLNTNHFLYRFLLVNALFIAFYNKTLFLSVLRENRFFNRF